MSAITSVNPATYVVPASTSGASSASSSTPSAAAQDAVELSLAGRIAIDLSNGSITSTQAQQLGAQLKTLDQSGSSNFSQLENQLSEGIYSDAHEGASIPTGATVTTAEERDFLQAGRIVNQELAGNLTSSQASGLGSQIATIYQDSQDGASASGINQAENRLSVLIYDTAHDITGTQPAQGSGAQS